MSARLYPDPYNPSVDWIIETDVYGPILIAASLSALLTRVLSFLNFNASTTDATVTPVATIALPTDSAVTFAIQVSGKRTNGAGRIGVVRLATAYREGAAAAAIQGAVQTQHTRDDDGAGSPTGYNITVTVSGNDLVVNVQGLSSHNVEWAATITKSEAS